MSLCVLDLDGVGAVREPQQLPFSCETADLTEDVPAFVVVAGRQYPVRDVLAAARDVHLEPREDSTANRGWAGTTPPGFPGGRNPDTSTEAVSPDVVQVRTRSRRDLLVRRDAQQMGVRIEGRLHAAAVAVRALYFSYSPTNLAMSP